MKLPKWTERLPKGLLPVTGLWLLGMAAMYFVTPPKSVQKQIALQLTFFTYFMFARFILRGNAKRWAKQLWLFWAIGFLPPWFAIASSRWFLLEQQVALCVLCQVLSYLVWLKYDRRFDYLVKGRECDAYDLEIEILAPTPVNVEVPPVPGDEWQGPQTIQQMQLVRRWTACSTSRTPTKFKELLAFTRRIAKDSPEPFRIVTADGVPIVKVTSSHLEQL